jgi:hypothetical protein
MGDQWNTTQAHITHQFGCRIFYCIVRVASPRLTFYYRAVSNDLITLTQVLAASLLHDQRDMAEPILGQLLLTTNLIGWLVSWLTQVPAVSLLHHAALNTRVPGRFDKILEYYRMKAIMLSVCLHIPL